MIIWRMCFGVLLVSFSFPSSGFAQNSSSLGSHGASGSPSETPSPAIVPATPITLLSSENNSVQLEVQVNGQFRYPFTFKADPRLTNDISISANGVVSGKPSKTDAQSTKITVTDRDGKTVAQYSVVLHFSDSVPVVLDSSSSAAPVGPGGKDPLKAGGPVTLSLNPMYTGGDTITGTAKSSSSGTGGTQNDGEAAPPAANPDTTPSAAVPANAKKSNTASKPASQGGIAVTITCTPDPARKPDSDEAQQTGCDPGTTATVTTDGNDAFSYQFNRSLYPRDLVSVTSGSVTQSTRVERPPLFLGEEMRAIVGYQQTGASSSDFTQDWFLDFYISRPLSLLRTTEEGHSKSKRDVSWRWWGNVRIASFPQPGNQTVADLATGLSTQVGALKLNQLAQGAEFLSGVEYQPFKSFPFRGFSENSRQIFTLGIIAGFGATGFFTAPSDSLQVFTVPALNSPQSGTFQTAYPGVTTPYVAFISPDVERFPKQYLAGIRLSTHYIDPTGKPLTSSPAMLALSLGQNQVITGDKLSGVVGRVEAFYPLPFGNRGQTTAGAFSSIYLFGTAQMRLGRSLTAPPLVLAAAPTTVSASDATVTLVTRANVRDEYRIGFGVDLVGLISSLTGGSSKKSTASGSAPKSTTTP